MTASPLPLRTRLGRLRCRVAHALERRLLGPRTAYVQDRVSEYRGYWSSAAELMGARFVALTDHIWEVRRGDARVRLSNYVVSADDPVTLRMAGDKALCYHIAAAAGVPVPLHGVFTLGRLEDARAFVGEHGGSWAVKPASGSASALGVTTHVSDWRGVRTAALLASLYDDRFIIERTVPAESCRLLFLGGEFVHAVRRRGARVIGDGRATVRDLLAAGGVPLDPCTRSTLEHEGISLDHVPAAGREHVVRGVPASERVRSELRTVYDESITEEVGAELIEETRRVVHAVGSEFAGVDVLTNHPDMSLSAGGGVFLEINTTPGIHHHYHTDQERAEHPVAVSVLEHLLERCATMPEKEVL